MPLPLRAMTQAYSCTCVEFVNGFNGLRFIAIFFAMPNDTWYAWSPVRDRWTVHRETDGGSMFIETIIVIALILAGLGLTQEASP